MKVTKQSVNGKPRGAFYDLDDGRVIYLGWRRTREIHKGAWILDRWELRACQERKVDAVGIVVGTGKVRRYWITLLSDFIESPHAFDVRDGVVHRALPLGRFRVDPTKCEAAIAKAIKIR